MKSGEAVRPDRYYQIIVVDGAVFDVSVETFQALGLAWRSGISNNPALIIREGPSSRDDLLDFRDIYGAHCLCRRSVVMAARETSSAIEDAYRLAHPEDQPDSDEPWRH